MPLLKVHSVNKSKIWGVWELTESADELLGQLDLSLENGAYAEIRHPKKIQEWAAAFAPEQSSCGRIDVPVLKIKYQIGWC